MYKKCLDCLCHTCLKSCKCQNCERKIKECARYSEFRQLNIFEPLTEPKYQKAPRYSWEYYGITKERYRKLTEYIQSGRYASLASQAAYITNRDIAEYILLSITKKLSWDALEKLWDLKKIERMSCGRSDFYGYRRYFYYIFDRKIKEIRK